MPITLLRQEHQTIRQLLTVADAQTAQLADNGQLDAEAMNGLLDLFKNILDGRLFAKEERCVQPILRNENWTETMLSQHHTLRGHRRQWAAALLAAEQGEELATPKIIDSLQVFTAGLRQYLDWEEAELYPHLEQCLGREERRHLQSCLERGENADRGL